MKTIIVVMVLASSILIIIGMYISDDNTIDGPVLIVLSLGVFALAFTYGYYSNG